MLNLYCKRMATTWKLGSVCEEAYSGKQISALGSLPDFGDQLAGILGRSDYVFNLLSSWLRDF